MNDMEQQGVPVNEFYNNMKTPNPNQNNFTQNIKGIKFHKVYCVLVWIQLVVGILSMLYSFLYDFLGIVYSPSGIIAGMVAFDVVQYISLIVILLIVAINLRKFKPVAYVALHWFWGLYVLFKAAMLIMSVVLQSDTLPYEIGNWIFALVGAVVVLVYYRRRKELFYPPKVIVCGTCGATQNAKSRFCTICGGKL